MENDVVDRYLFDEVFAALVMWRELSKRERFYLSSLLSAAAMSGKLASDLARQLHEHLFPKFESTKDIDVESLLAEAQALGIDLTELEDVLKDLGGEKHG